MNKKNECGMGEVFSVQSSVFRRGTHANRHTAGFKLGRFCRSLASSLRLRKFSVFSFQYSVVRRDRRPSDLNTEHWILNTLFSLFLLAALAPRAEAGDGTWTYDGSDNWSTASRWSGNNIADGIGSTADFSTLNIGGKRAVTISGARTNGYLKFADTTPGGTQWWILRPSAYPPNNDSLTLATSSGSPTIYVGPVATTPWGLTACISVPLKGTQGFTAYGPGWLGIWGNNSVAHTITGGITVNRGCTVQIIDPWDGPLDVGTGGSMNDPIPTSNPLTLNGGSFSFYGQTSRTQTLNGLTFSGASSCGAGGYSATMTLTFGAITRTSNGVIWFNNGETAACAINTTTGVNGSGILGTYAFYYNLSTPWYYATKSGNRIWSYSASTVSPDSFISATANYDFSSGATLNGTRTAYTARCTATGASTIGLNGNTLTLNGLLNAGGASSGLLTINGSGSVVIGTDNELVVAAAANAITIAAPITDGASTGTLTKAGGSTLTLSGINTYTGDTWVHEGSLALTSSGGLTFKIGASNVNNRIRGYGTVALDGAFTFDLTGAGTTAGDSWTIVDSTLTTNYTANFTVNGSTSLGNGTWRKIANNCIYVFAKSNGVLTVSGYSPPDIANEDVSGVTTTGATFNGRLVQVVNASAVYVLWGTDTNAWAKTNWWTGGGWTNNTPFGTNITAADGLQADATYYYTFGATNSQTSGLALFGVKNLITGLVKVEATDTNVGVIPLDTGAFTISRPATCTNEALTVYYTLSLSQCTAPAGPVTLPAGVTSTNITVTPYPGPGGSATLTLTGGYNYPTGAQNSATIAIPYLDGTGIWTNLLGGSWVTAGNWRSNAIADGIGATADFSTLDITTFRDVTSSGARTIGNLKFGDTVSAGGNNGYWRLRAPTWPNTGDGILTLDVPSGSPVITVNKATTGNWGLTACVSVPLAGTKGLTVSGPGILQLFFSDYAHAITGGFRVTQGSTLGLSYSWSSAVGGNPGSTYGFPSGNSLTLDGGSFNFGTDQANGGDQAWNGLTFSGASACSAAGYQSTTILRLNSITRAPTSNGVIWLNNNLAGGNGSDSSMTTTTANNPTTGILGPYAFYKRDKATAGVWAYATGGGTITVYSASTVSPDSFSGATANYDYSSGATLTGNRTAYTARCTATGASTIGLNGNTLTLNGLLNAGTNSSSGLLTINGAGSVVIGSDNELVVAAAANAITIAAPIVNGASAGGLTKAGVSNLTLSAVNTYTGDTWVHEGSLTLTSSGGLTFKIGASNVNNRIRGYGTVALDGAFTFDLTGAGTTLSNQWTIVDSTLTTNYTANFTVNGSTNLANGKWRIKANSCDYEFNKATGVLTITGKSKGTVFMFR